jgi:hypothetical protein
MSNTSSTTIACALCLGATAEPYLAAALEAVKDAVDVLTVNDNSGLARSDNATILEGSAFAARGALHVRAHPFVDFADMRNRAFAQLRALPVPPQWVLFLDADEVHGEQIRYIAREILPHLGPEIGNLDAYTYHFWGTPRWITDVARRFVFYRYAPDLAWTNAVHEKIANVRGGALVIPYTYHHYGNVLPPALLARKHLQYYGLGNRVPQPPSEADASEAMYLEKAHLVRPYGDAHPRAARATLARLDAENRESFGRLEGEFRARRTTLDRVNARARAMSDTLRVELRRLEHPLVYRAATRAR